MQHILGAKMIKSVGITSFSAPNYVAQALEGEYGLDQLKNFSLTVIKGVGIIHASGPLTLSEYLLPQPAMPFHLVKCSEGALSAIPVSGSKLSLTLSEGETVEGTFRLKI